MPALAHGEARRPAPPHARPAAHTILAVLVAGLSLAALSAPARADEAPDVRLGRDVVPGFQLVRLKLDPDKRSYSGSVHVELRVERATDTLRFHADGQKLVRVSLAQGSDSVADPHRR